jgi:hypothetical protein
MYISTAKAFFMRILRLLSCLAFLPLACAAQNLYQKDSSIKVFQYGAERQLAWAGGFKSPQFAQADLNRDGLADLVVFEWGDNVIQTFLNKGSASAARYVYAPQFERRFPHVQDYLKLEDVDRDGVADLIHKGISGFEIWKGYYNANNELSFSFLRQLRYNLGSSSINAYSQAGDIPAVVDVDGDGDLDFLAYDVTGGFITFYKNCQAELGLPKDTIVICVPSNCWGHMFQGFQRSYTLGLAPGGCSSFGTFSLCKSTAPQKQQRHQGNCMLMFDYEGDGDMDLLDGNITFPDIQFLRNGRKDYHWATDTVVAQDTAWQSSGHPALLPQWPSAFYVDADGDGRKDLLVTPHYTTAGENYKTVMFYRNTGTAAAPIFSYQNDTFLVDQTLDFGTGSYPVLYDYNRDGRLDLFVGSDGYFQPDGTLRSRIAYYQNSRVGNQTRFTLVTPDFLGLAAFDFEGAAPAIGDLDGDGDDDLVIGHTDGTLSYFENTASAASAQPMWSLAQRAMTDANGAAIDVGYFASPYIYDIDKDSKPDLLCGNQAGEIYFYKSNPTPLGPGLLYETDKLGDVEAMPGNNISGFSSLWIGKIDSTGAEYLVSGNGAGNLTLYTGFQTGNVTAPYAVADSFYDQIDVGLRSTLAVGDLDGDGKPDMIMGNRLGGLNLFKKRLKLPVAGTPAPVASCMVYPNPARNEVVVSWDAAFADGSQQVRLRIVDALGSVVRQWQGSGASRAVRIPVAALTPGVYSCVAEGPGNRQVTKLSVIQ